MPAHRRTIGHCLLASVSVAIAAALLLSWHRIASASKESFRSGVNIAQYASIVEVYRTVLERSPTKQELGACKLELENDPSFSIPMLESRLRSSREYTGLVGAANVSGYAGVA